MDLGASLIIRVALCVQYAGLTLAGAGMLTAPSILIQSTMGTIIYAWAAMLVLGGTLCLIGGVTRLWIGEFTGLLMLTIANWMWGAALIVSTNGGSASTKYGIVLISWGFGLLARWVGVLLTARGAARSARERRTNG